MRDDLLFELPRDEDVGGPPAVVGRSRSQACIRRVTPTSVSGAGVERFLPNGDSYIGSLSGKVPHGIGKYLWTDGCMYEGEWRRGKATGKGKFSWSSGATFEGEFKVGRIDGFGTFIGINGDTYRGSWSADRKHGFGQKLYANGDFYEGSWKRNVQDGKGRYVWKIGNEYVGEWKNGVISGRGVLIWVNGNRYDGKWENGVPLGKGVFTWLDGSCYVGNWNKDMKIQQCKKSTNDAFSGDDFMAALMPRKRSSVDSSKICVWESDGEAGDITCDIIDYPCCFSGKVKKPGQTISKGHRNYDLMINLQLGISHSVERYSSIARELKPSDFDPKEKFWTKFPSEGSKITLLRQSVEFRWKDYCPIVFRHLRELFEVDSADYMMAICGNDALRELSSPGKSGSFFYVTQDDGFMIKTVRKSEVKVLIRMLPSYYQHVSQYENSLVTKFFGVHCVKPIGGQKTRFIVMDNLFCSEYRIHRRFDLKGSSHGRTTDKLVGEIDETSTLKDLDLNFVFRLQGNRFQELIKQIGRDCKFLEAERIMDYSLLVGVHFRDVNSGDIIGWSPVTFHSGKQDWCQFLGNCHLLEAGILDMDGLSAGRKSLIRLGANMPARAERVIRRRDFDQYTPGRFNLLTPSHSGEIYEVVLYFGIIDILQDYDISKKLEHAYKSLQADPTSISAVDPKLYSKRFRDFIEQIFIEER